MIDFSLSDEHRSVQALVLRNDEPTRCMLPIPGR